MNHSRVFVIAEAGVNHNGDIEIARRLIDVAADAGVDAVKFQTFKADRLVTAAAEKADYQKITTGISESQLDMLRRLELSSAQHEILIDHCRRRGIMFASTPFDEESVDLLEQLKVGFIKIPSGEVTNRILIEHVAAKAMPVILSTGMSEMQEVKDALNWLGDGPKSGAGLPAITVLHCLTDYPAADQDLNLRAIGTMAQELGVQVGYSDHSLGIEMAFAAVALGATVIEKHFTLDRSLPGPDQKASVEPAELAAMISGIRRVSLALGDGKKQIAPSERANAAVVRKSIVAAKHIAAGEIFTRVNLTAKRPGIGLAPSKIHELLGRVSSRDYRPDEMIDSCG